MLFKEQKLTLVNGLTGLLVTSSATLRESLKGAGKEQRKTPRDNVKKKLMQVCQFPQKKRSVMLTIHAQVNKQPFMKILIFSSSVYLRPMEKY